MILVACHSSFAFRLEGSPNAIIAKKMMMPASFFISLKKEDFKAGNRTLRTKYYLGKIKVKNSKEVRSVRSVRNEATIDVPLHPHTLSYLRSSCCTTAGSTPTGW